MGNLVEDKNKMFFTLIFVHSKSLLLVRYTTLVKNGKNYSTVKKLKITALKHSGALAWNKILSHIKQIEYDKKFYAMKFKTNLEESQF